MPGKHQAHPLGFSIDPFRVFSGNVVLSGRQLAAKQKRTGFDFRSESAILVLAFFSHVTLGKSPNLSKLLCPIYKMEVVIVPSPGYHQA